jgi:hypothetical protein
MADLLECLLQIKGLRETCARLATLARSLDSGRWNESRSGGRLTARELLVRMAETELLYGAVLRQMVGGARIVSAVEPQSLDFVAGRLKWSAGQALERFTSRRRDNLEVLDACSAEDLSRKARHPVRREVTVADLVALMLATDVEQVGEIRRAVGA